MSNIMQKIAGALPAPGQTVTQAAPSQAIPGVPKRAKVTPLDITHELMIGGMLSGPSTHMFNLADNTLKSLTSPLETATRGLVSMARPAEDKTYLKEAVYEAYGLFTGYGKGLQFIGSRIKNAIPGLPNESVDQTLAKLNVSPELSKSSKTGHSQQRTITGENILGTGTGLLAKTVDTIGVLANLPGTALNTADILGKIVQSSRIKSGMSANYMSQGKAKTFDEAWKLVTADPEMSKRIVKTANEWTYQGEPDSYMKLILSPGVDKIPGMRFVVPFRRAIANLFEHTLERSPLIVTSPTLMKKLVSKDPGIADEARAKFIFGMTALTSLSMLTDGHLTGAAPEGRLNKDEWLRVNGAEDQLTIGDQSWDLRNFGVYGNFMRTIARYNQWLANTPVPEYEQVYKNEADKYMHDFGAFIAPIVDTMYDNHWGKNLVEFMSIVEEAIQEKDATRLAKFMERNLSLAVPVYNQKLMRDAAVAGDPYSKRHDAPGDFFLGMLPKYRKMIPNNFTWDGHPMLVGSLLKGVGSRKLVEDTYGPPDDFDKLLVGLGVDFPEPSRKFTMASEQRGAPAIAEYLQDQEWVEYNSLRRTGFGGLPGVRQFIQDTLINTRYFKSLEASPYNQKAEIEYTYKVYNAKLKEFYAKTHYGHKGVGARLIERYKKQIEYKTALLSVKGDSK